jgi:hypothetical protein
MSYEERLKADIMMGDFKCEDEDEYIKMLESDSKKNLLLKIGMGAFYILLLVVSLFIV